MTSIKLGWGTRIALLYLGFVAIIVTLVTGSMRQSFDLVSKDYYSEELKYQDVIGASRNQAALSEAVSLRQTAQQVEIRFPEEFRKSNLKGSVQFYAQVNADWDRVYQLDVRDGRCSIPAGGLQATTYLVKLQWTANGKKYYQQTPLTIQR